MTFFNSRNVKLSLKSSLFEKAGKVLGIQLVIEVSSDGNQEIFMTIYERVRLQELLCSVPIAMTFFVTIVKRSQER